MPQTIAQSTDSVDTITSRIKSLSDEELADLCGETTAITIYTAAGKTVIPVESDAEAMYVAAVEPFWLGDIKTCCEKRAALAVAPERERDTMYIEALDRSIAHMTEGVRRHYETRQAEYRERQALEAAIHRAEATLRLHAGHARQLRVRRCRAPGAMRLRSSAPMRQSMAAKKATAKAAADPDGPSEPPGKRGASQIGGAL